MSAQRFVLPEIRRNVEHSAELHLKPVEDLPRFFALRTDIARRRNEDADTFHSALVIIGTGISPWNFAHEDQMQEEDGRKFELEDRRVLLSFVGVSSQVRVLCDRGGTESF